MILLTVMELWKRRLKQPGAPCLSVGSSNKPVWLPAEVCRIRPGQRKLKLDDKQTAEARTTVRVCGDRWSC